MMRSNMAALTITSHHPSGTSSLTGNDWGPIFMTIAGVWCLFGSVAEAPGGMERDIFESALPEARDRTSSSRGSGVSRCRQRSLRAGVRDSRCASLITGPRLGENGRCASWLTTQPTIPTAEEGSTPHISWAATGSASHE